MLSFVMVLGGAARRHIRRTGLSATLLLSKTLANPNAIGHNDGVAEDVYLEVTGSFFIMIYNYQKLTGDTAWVQKYSSNFQVYADHLINNGLYPSSQCDTVGSIPATANQTNLAVISAIGLNAYGAVTGNRTYTQKARDFVNEINTKTLGTDESGSNTAHLTYNYGDSSSWGILFNFFPDQFLDLNTFLNAAVSIQCDSNTKQRTSVSLPFASVQDNIANGMWNMWIAAICPGALPEALFNDEQAFLANRKNTAPFPDRFYATGDNSGEFVQARARPTLGSTFASLAMNDFSVDSS